MKVLYVILMTDETRNVQCVGVYEHLVDAQREQEKEEHEYPDISFTIEKCPLIGSITL